MSGLILLPMFIVLSVVFILLLILAPMPIKVIMILLISIFSALSSIKNEVDAPKSSV
jgi:hypothetical protein